jgi:hypothetical protein
MYYIISDEEMIFFEKHLTVEARDGALNWAKKVRTERAITINKYEDEKELAKRVRQFIDG